MATAAKGSQIGELIGPMPATSDVITVSRLKIERCMAAHASLAVALPY
jgi:hypothetical protein